jgi:hypothetical protein
VLSQAIPESAGVPAALDFVLVIVVQTLFMVYILRAFSSGSGRRKIIMAVGLIIPIAIFGIIAEITLPVVLLAEAVRVSRKGGVILFSSYSPQIWDARLEWFRDQARAGLVGEIDEQQTQPGTIVCKDGFRSSTVSGADFSALFARLGQEARITEVDSSSVFAQVAKQT